MTGGKDSVIRVWDLSKNKQKFVLLGHNMNVTSIALTNHPNFIISGSYDASVRVWDMMGRKQVALLKGHEDKVLAICYV